MPDAHPLAASLLAALLLAAPLHEASRAAEPSRYALVIGNGAYASMPPLPACRGAASSLAETLRAQGYQVTERADTGRGTLDAALGQFARRLHDAADETAVVYFCGYAAQFEGRVFLLPVSATLERDADALTQGVLARSAAEAAARGSPRAGAVLLDLVPRPGAKLDGAALQPVQDRAAEASLALMAVAGQPGGAPATPLAAALRAELLPGVGGLPASVVAALRQRLAGRPDIAVLAVSASPPPAAVQPAPPPPASESPPRPSSPTAPGAVAPPGNEAALVEEGRLPEADRRRIQAALATDGFYSGRLDGIFGPEVRAAIRRYQARLGAEATGRLTEGQARRLLDAAR